MKSFVALDITIYLNPLVNPVFFKPLQVQGFIRKQSLHKAKTFFKVGQKLEGVLFFADKKRIPSITPKRKERFDF